MEQKIIQTNFGNILCLDITEYPDEFFFIHGKTRVATFNPTYKRFDLPDGEKEIVGKLSELTEIQSRPFIEPIFIEIQPSPSNDMSGSWDIGFVDYENRGEFAGYNGDAGCFINPIDSFKSLLKSNDIDINKEWLIIKIEQT